MRRALEEQAQLNLGQQMRILQAHVERRKELEQQRLTLIVTLELEKKHLIAAPRYVFYMEAIGDKEREIVQQINTIESQTVIVEQCRLELAEKVKGRKVLEKLREKKLQQFKEAELVKVQNENDEMAILRFGR